MTKLFFKDSAGKYRTQKPVSKKQIINFAYQLIVPDFVGNGVVNSAASCADFLKIALADESKENFGVVFLTSQLQVISFEIVAKGTVKEAYVHPRTVVGRVLDLNASAVILAHNHPGIALDPSEADKAITARLKEALEAIDVNVLDHMIIGGDEYYSFAENGLM